MGDSRRQQESAEVYCYVHLERLSMSRRHWQTSEVDGSLAVYSPTTNLGEHDEHAIGPNYH